MRRHPHSGDRRLGISIARFFPWRVSALGYTVLLAIAGATVASARPYRPTIILIGGDTPHNPGIHASRDVVTKLLHDLASSPDIGDKGISVRAYPNGWPADFRSLRNATTIVWYFDGIEHHPLLDRSRRGQFARLMRRGVGLVAFHQASTLPADDHTIELIHWLGGVRYGMVDRTVETATLTPARHPIANGVPRFTYRDEFYPSIRFAATGVIPILTGMVHLEAAPDSPPTQHVIAWAFERPGGGRSFGFTGLHYSTAVDQPELCKLLLNAIVWTAGLPVPPGGVTVMPAKK